MFTNYDLIRLFSLVITNSHISNNEIEKKTCLYFNNLECFNVAVNDNDFSCFENLFLNTTEKRDCIVTNATPTKKDLKLLLKKDIKKIFIITPSNNEEIQDFLNNVKNTDIQFEFISLEDKHQLIKNIEKDKLINLNDSFFDL